MFVKWNNIKNKETIKHVAIWGSAGLLQAKKKVIERIPTPQQLPILAQKNQNDI